MTTKLFNIGGQAVLQEKEQGFLKE